MSCPHDHGLVARWDYLSSDGSCGTGWIVCESCDRLLQRITLAAGKIRGQGRFLSAFREQVSRLGAIPGYPA